jgi:hypothetical protein
MGRHFGSYSATTYERWQSGGVVDHPVANLGALIDAYISEASGLLAAVLQSMRQQWP